MTEVPNSDNSPSSNLDRKGSRTETIDPKATEEDLGTENRLRPNSLGTYCGQNQVKDSLTIAIEAAKARSAPLDHILFHGPPGLGKTTLAMILAAEMGVSIRITSGPALERAGDLAALLTSLQPGDILFIDEIHRLNSIVEEYLYSAIEDYRIEIMIEVNEYDTYKLPFLFSFKIHNLFNPHFPTIWFQSCPFKVSMMR